MITQIISTWNCNFACAHCLFSCSPRKKGFVDRDDFNEFIREMSRYDEYVNLVGGEPSQHPDFLWHLERLTSLFDDVRVVTNGLWLCKNHALREEFEERFYGNRKLSFLVSDDPWHECFWPAGFTAVKAKSILSGIEIKTEEDYRRRNMYVSHLGRAIRTGLGQSNGNSCTCFDEEYRFDPCLLPNGSVASCCNGRLVVGDCRNSRYELEERFLEVMVKRKRAYREDECYKCPAYAKEYKHLKSRRS